MKSHMNVDALRNGALISALLAVAEPLRVLAREVDRRTSMD